MKTIKNIAHIILGLLIILFISEIFIRTTYITNVSSTEFYDDIGRGKRPNLDYVYFNEGFGVGRINEHRYLGKSVPLEKENNELRIALLGDSFIEAFHVFERDYFGNIVSNKWMEEKNNGQLEMLNFGRSGFDIGDMYAYQKTLAEKFNPDYFFYFLSNDDLRPAQRDPLRKTTQLKDDLIVLNTNFHSSDLNTFQKTKALTQQSSILNMLNDCRKKAKETAVLSILLDKVYYWFNKEVENPNEDLINKEFVLPAITSKILDTFDRDKIVVINRDKVPLPEAFINKLRQKNIPYFDLSIPLLEMKKQGVDPYYWEVTKKFGHWNKLAHETVANSVINIIDQILPKE